MSETRLGSGIDRKGALAVATAIVLAAIAVLATLVVPADPASAETPAERCARETATYNSAWAQTWAASNGRPASEAPPPPVPYVCHDPGPTTTTTSQLPVVTAPTVPSDTNVPEGPGPNMGAHAPIDIPEAGDTPIVPVPGADRGVPVVPRSAAPALLPAPRIPLPGRTLARDWTPDSGLPPFAACGSSDERKEIQDYEVAGDRRAFMRCGNKKYSFEHIKGEHMTDWEKKAALSGDLWMNLMHMSIKETLANPEVTELQKPQREGHSATWCYSRQIHLYDKRTGELTGTSFWSNVLVSDRNGDIITAFPKTDGPHCKAS